MINLYVQHLMIMAFSIWPIDKAECFAQHIDPALLNPKLTQWQVDYWASTFYNTERYKEFKNRKYIIDD